MGRFVISPHFRLHEWVAEEKGHFDAEGLDYEFRSIFKTHVVPNKVGAYTGQLAVKTPGGAAIRVRRYAVIGAEEAREMRVCREP